MSIPLDLQRPHIHWDNIRIPMDVVPLIAGRGVQHSKHPLIVPSLGGGRTIAEAMPDFSGYNRDAPVKVLSWKNPKP